MLIYLFKFCQDKIKSVNHQIYAVEKGFCLIDYKHNEF